MSETLSWSGRTAFITGATGLLGSHLTRLLVERGAEVVALVRDTVPRSLFFDASPEWRLHERVTTVCGEIEDYELIERISNEYAPHFVFHLAAQPIVGLARRSPLATFRANIEGTWNVLEAARVTGRPDVRIVVASSDKAYGVIAGGRYGEDSPLLGEHPYDVSKACADRLARAYFGSYGQRVAITRCGNFFGPGDLNANRLIPETISAVLEGRRPEIRSDGRYVRDYLYVEDGAEAYLKLAEVFASDDSISGEAFNFSYGVGLSVLDVVQRISEKLGREDLEPVIRDEVRHEIPVQTLDSSKAREWLRWSPRVGFDEGLDRTIEWYRNRSLIRP